MSDDAPTEPRESESGQEQATDTEDQTMVEGDREQRESHPDDAGAGTHGSVEPVATRETSPMSEFTGRQAGIGALVAVVGLAVTFAIPLLLTLG
ncbi:DUF7550 family protein [Halococcus thailandensis]|uniref:Uncharacterized protein n=1 Tax=Halococcus thailandensis JCM 13552 TaxID=1227457 RepID=M0N350_9EURY|nr:hypothetical protein [Halococcus thailandensis]EMA51120.1 hypothetical protein C451_15538 [Halococcus thailandensis JCM 13552]